MTLPRSKRKRGVVLTLEGLARLQAAIQKAEVEENNGKRYTLEDLGDRIRIAPKTVSKVFDRDVGTDRRTLELCFSAFQLDLSPWDYDHSGHLNDLEAEDDLGSEAPILQRLNSLEFPEGVVPLNSRCYIERPPMEELAYAEVGKPGSLLRIKAARQMGKTSLVQRILASARGQNFCTVSLSLQRVDREVLASTNQFLRWLCTNISRQLDLNPHLDDYWDEDVGSKMSCTIYLQEDVLQHLQTPLVLALDEVNCLFEHPDVAQDVLPLLRSWHEEAGDSDLWQNLRLVVAYATEVYIPLNLNQSPFNVGMPIELPVFTVEQVQVLAHRYGLNWAIAPKGLEKLTPLLDMVGGHPYLIRLALYRLAREDIDLDHLLQTAPTVTGIYATHLRHLLNAFMAQPELATAFRTIVGAEDGVPLTEIAQETLPSAIAAYKLESLGLVRIENNSVWPRCELYRLYFREQLATGWGDRP